MNRRRTDGAFTLIELLVVIAVTATLAALLLSALGRSRQRAYMVKCISNLRQIGIGLQMYLEANNSTFPPAHSHQFNPEKRPIQSHGDFLGGIDGTARYQDIPPANQRLLAPYVSAGEVFHCPADRGTIEHPSRFESVGCSYRLNHRLPDGYRNAGLAADPVYNLAFKKESWVTDPTRFISIHEYASYPWYMRGFTPFPWLMQWHDAAAPANVFFESSTVQAERKLLVAPALFVDGHSQRCDFTATIKKNPMLGLEPTKDWIWYKPAQ